MDFFTSQARAERHSRHIAWMFVPSVILTAVCVSLPLLFWTPIAFGVSCLVTSAIIVLGMLWQLNLYRAGGPAVAASVGARRVIPNTTDFRERRLLDVVEELAIAASVPVPPVYILDDEVGINAFAAGFGPPDAVITVTRGALQVLSRDELQAVVGHEMSHIVHSDVRLNLRLAALVSGLLLIVTLGLLISRIALQGESGTSSDSKGNGAAILLGIMLFGSVAAAVGWVGMIVGQMLQASVCRQREFLADASSVQYTRNPGAMCSALAKIKVLPGGSEMDHHQSMNVAHMLFAGPSAHWWSQLVATHPPIEHRLGAIDANYKIDANALAADAARQRALTHDADAVVPPSPASARAGVENARQLFGTWPPGLRQASRNPAMAGALAAGLLMSTDIDVRARQFQALQNADPALHDKTAALMPAIDSAGVHSAVPLANLVSPALSHLPTEERSRLNVPLNATVQAADGGHALSQSLYGLLQARARSSAVPSAPRYVALAPVVDKVAIVLASLSRTVTGADNAGAAAFARGAAALKYPDLPYPADESPDLFIAAIESLDSAAGPVKARVIDALTACVNDPTGKPTPDSLATLRAIAASLHCPMA
jgi:Zn-dependent protease with chaperone function